MGMSVSSVPTSGVSNLYVQQRLLGQLESDQSGLLDVETQLSTDKELSAASQDPVVAMQIMNLNNLLASNAQMTTNVTTNQSYMTETDSALSNVSSLLATAQSHALAVTGSTATADQRTAAAQQINVIVQELMNLGNQQFDGRYLFAGSTTTVMPFTTTASGDIQYNGNDQNLTSFSDLNLPFVTNVTGRRGFRRRLRAGRRRRSQSGLDRQHQALRSQRRRGRQPRQHRHHRRQRTSEHRRSQRCADRRRRGRNCSAPTRPPAARSKSA